MYKLDLCLYIFIYMIAYWCFWEFFIIITTQFQNKIRTIQPQNEKKKLGTASLIPNLLVLTKKECTSIINHLKFKCSMQNSMFCFV